MNDVVLERLKGMRSRAERDLGFRLDNVCFVTVKRQGELGSDALRFRDSEMKNSHLEVQILSMKEKAWVSPSVRW